MAVKVSGGRAAGCCAASARRAGSGRRWPGPARPTRGRRFLVGVVLGRHTVGVERLSVGDAGGQRLAGPAGPPLRSLLVGPHEHGRGVYGQEVVDHVPVQVAASGDDRGEVSQHGRGVAPGAPWRAVLERRARGCRSPGWPPTRPTRITGRCAPGWNSTIAYVLAVARDHRVPAGAGRTVRADELAARLPRRAWQRLSAGDGAKGHRWYDWVWVTISNPGPGHRCLLIRRNRSTGELAFYHCYSPQRVTLAALVKVAGLRWTIEENFQAGKGLTGLDEHQVRRWNSWYRWVTLAMLAAAVLTIAAAIESARGPAAAGQIPLTRNEIAHLLAAVTAPPGRDAGHRLRWSHWRRRHQHRARTCHYQRQITQDHAT